MTFEDTKKRTIPLIIDQSIYDEYMNNSDYAHEIIKTCYAENTHLFPSCMSKGYSLKGKQGYPKRQVYRCVK